MSQETRGTTLRRPVGTISIDTKTVFDRLAKCSVGDLVTYKELSDLLGRDVRGHGRWVLNSACRMVFNQSHMLFGAVPGEGVKRLNDQEIVATAADGVRRVHKLSLRSVRKLGAIQNFDALPAVDKLRHNTYVSALGILAHFTKERQLKRLEEKVEKAQVALPLQRTLEAFRDLDGPS